MHFFFAAGGVLAPILAEVALKDEMVKEQMENLDHELTELQLLFLFVGVFAMVVAFCFLISACREFLRKKSVYEVTNGEAVEVDVIGENDEERVACVNPDDAVEAAAKRNSASVIAPIAMACIFTWYIYVYILHVLQVRN